MKIQMNEIKLPTLRQTDISDTAKNELCLVYSGGQMAYQLRRRNEMKKGVKLPTWTMKDVDEFIDKAIGNGGVYTEDGVNSLHGMAKNHRKIAEAAGLYGYDKEYVKYDSAKIMALLQWDSLVELRDEGRHSLLATGWYKEDDKFYCSTSDPWPYSDDLRLDCARAMTQKKVNGKWVDSRSIEYFAFYYKIGTDPKWIE